MFIQKHLSLNEIFSHVNITELLTQSQEKTASAPNTEILMEKNLGYFPVTNSDDQIIHNL